MKAFLITIDTEGDDLWSKPREITTRNASALPRFQTLCERFGFIPTYLTDYEMASDPAYVDWAADLQARSVAEVGMHLHAWNTPPDWNLTEDDYECSPYMTEYPPEIILKKTVFMTELIERNFGKRPVSHRAGRYGLNEAYAKVLAGLSYRVDCSVVPGFSFAQQKGLPDGKGGPGFVGCPSAPYYLDLKDIRKPGDSSLLEVPVTVHSTFRALAGYSPRWSIARSVVSRLRQVCWLRPNGRNLDRMLNLVDLAIQKQAVHLEFILHSSEFMAGGSPTFRTEGAIDKLYSDLEVLFTKIERNFIGMSLNQFSALFENLAKVQSDSR